MPRQFKRVDSSIVQGDDSYVEFRSLLWRDAKRLQELVRNPDDRDDAKEVESLIVKLVVNWNWTDDDGEALPLPRDESAVIERLTADEVNWLIENMGQGPGERKN